MFTFRASITFTVMVFVVALAALLIAIQVRSLRWATQEAASAYMDATSTKALGRLQGELKAITSLVHVLATSSSVADSDESRRQAAQSHCSRRRCSELPQMDSIYAGFENGAWLQVRRISDLTEEQRERLRAPANADMVINLIRPTPGGDLPMRRIFQDSRATRSMKSICGNTATTPANVPGTGRRCRRTGHMSRRPIFLSASARQ